MIHIPLDDVSLSFGAVLGVPTSVTQTQTCTTRTLRNPEGPPPQVFRNKRVGTTGLLWFSECSLPPESLRLAHCRLFSERQMWVGGRDVLLHRGLLTVRKGSDFVASLVVGHQR